MQVWNSMTEVPTDLPRTVVALGCFDGVHRGHRAVLRRVVELARAEGAMSVAVTFTPHLRVVHQPDAPHQEILSPEQRAVFLAETGLDALKSLAILMLAFYVTCGLFVFVMLGTILKLATGVNIFRLLKYLGREFLLILSTSSSESALPRLMAKMEHAGVDKTTVGVVVPILAVLTKATYRPSSLIATSPASR